MFQFVLNPLEFMIASALQEPKIREIQFPTTT
jgi:hypothetical protein